MRIKVRHIVLGTHNWPDAGEMSKDIEFLASEHHHDFTIWVECDVQHHDREVEFILLRRDLMKAIDQGFPGKYIKRFGDYSCEMIGEFVKEVLEDKYGNRNFKIEVYEDNIQGAIIQ